MTSIQMQPSRLTARSVQCLPIEAASALPYDLCEQSNAILRSCRIRCIVQTSPLSPLAGVVPTPQRRPNRMSSIVNASMAWRTSGTPCPERLGPVSSTGARLPLALLVQLVHAVGAGRKCMEKAMSMFAGKGNHGFPAVVVETAQVLIASI